MRYLLTIEYDGTSYCGWQQQEGLSTIQACLQKAILLMSGEEVEVFGSGRTDAGVHATYQRAHFDLQKFFTPYQLREGINFHLKDEAISVIDIQPVSDTLHARFSAIKRAYQYKILNRPAFSPLLHNRVWHYKYPLDISLMKQAGQDFLGTHDFTAFRAKECQSKSPVKTLDKLEITQSQEMIDVNLEARSFLHHQVRNIVGTLVWIGAKKISANAISQIFKSLNRSQAGPTAPACGLYLIRVDYPQELCKPIY